MAQALAEARVDAVYSYAGRTEAPVAQPLPVRVGGFGGVAGLVDYLRAEGIGHVIDATHPFAAQMSRNAVDACAEAAVPLVALEREPWQAGEGDRWTHVPDLAAAVEALGEAPRRVFLLQRKSSKVGDGLAKTTGWIRRTLLKKRRVQMIGGVTYERIDDAGLHVTVDGEPKTLAVDTIVICAGQEPRRDLQAPLEAAGIPFSLIGGADIASELDAKRAIDQGTRLAASL